MACRNLKLRIRLYLQPSEDTDTEDTQDTDTESDDTADTDPIDTSVDTGVVDTGIATQHTYRHGNDNRTLPKCCG